MASGLEGQGHGAVAVTTDVTDRRSASELAAAAIDEYGKIDILVNDAGVIGAPGWWEREFPNDDDWDLALAVNLRGVVNVTEAVMGHMKERRYGKIVNIASIAARYGNVDIPNYNASKSAVVSWTQSNALQLAPYGVNVNAICPGILWTPMFHRIAEKRARYNADPAFDGSGGPCLLRAAGGRLDPDEARADARGRGQAGRLPSVGRRKEHHWPGGQRGRRPPHELATCTFGRPLAGYSQMIVGEFEIHEPAPKLRNVCAIAMLRPWVDVGRVGTLVLNGLEKHTRARELGRLARPGTFFDFTRYRPRTRNVGGRRVFTTPNSIAHYARSEETGRDFIFLHLREPHAMGEDYTDAIVDAAPALQRHRVLSYRRHV